MIFRVSTPLKQRLKLRFRPRLRWVPILPMCCQFSRNCQRFWSKNWGRIGGLHCWPGLHHRPGHHHRPRHCCWPGPHRDLRHRCCDFGQHLTWDFHHKTGEPKGGESRVVGAPMFQSVHQKAVMAFLKGKSSPGHPRFLATIGLEEKSSEDEAIEENDI